jgi:hypothetical protein
MMDRLASAWFRWTGLLSECLPHRQRWVAVPRPALTAWYVHQETQTVTYLTKGY